MIIYKRIRSVFKNKEFFEYQKFDTTPKQTLGKPKTKDNGTSVSEKEYYESAQGKADIIKRRMEQDGN